MEDIFTEAFTYNGDGTFTITEDALREVFYVAHLGAAVRSSSLVKFDDYYLALSNYEKLKVSEVEDKAERDKLVEDMEYDGTEAQFTLYEVKNGINLPDKKKGK